MITGIVFGLCCALIFGGSFMCCSAQGRMNPKAAGYAKPGVDCSTIIELLRGALYVWERNKAGLAAICEMREYYEGCF